MTTEKLLKYLRNYYPMNLGVITVILDFYPVPANVSANSFAQLKEKDLKIILLLARGKTTREVARILGYRTGQGPYARFLKFKEEFVKFNDAARICEGLDSVFKKLDRVVSPLPMGKGDVETKTLSV